MNASKVNSAQHEGELLPDAEKLAALVEFSAAAGHEINNPLAVILGRTSLLLREEEDPARRQTLETIAGQALRIRDMIGDVMLFADPPPLHVVEMPSVRSMIEEVISRQRASMQAVLDRAIPEITFPSGPDGPLQADRDQFLTAVGEIVRNALHPSSGAGRIEVRLDEVDAGTWRLMIIDDGHGLSPKDRQHLFDPFYSGRQAGRGLGFGLCKAYRFVTGHGGRISVRCSGESSEKRGLVFQLDWPRIAEQGGCESRTNH